MTSPGAAAAQADFAAIEATLAASERGRRFLAEYARRRREQDLARLLAVADRIEAEGARASQVVRDLAEALKELRPLAEARLRAREMQARGAPERNGGLERRFAALVRLEAGELEAGASVFG